jgi:hypothetical protein
MHGETVKLIKTSVICEQIHLMVFLPHSDCLDTVIVNLHETYQCRMYSTPDDEQRGCPKHVEFYDRINLVN